MYIIYRCVEHSLYIYIGDLRNCPALILLLSVLYGHCRETWTLNIAVTKMQERTTQECPGGKKTRKMKTL